MLLAGDAGDPVWARLDLKTRGGEESLPQEHEAEVMELGVAFPDLLGVGRTGGALATSVRRKNKAAANELGEVGAAPPPPS